MPLGAVAIRDEEFAANEGSDVPLLIMRAGVLDDGTLALAGSVTNAEVVEFALGLGKAMLGDRTVVLAGSVTKAELVEFDVGRATEADGTGSAV